MRRFAFVIPLLAASPALAQQHSVFDGASPETMILSGGWEMTPRGTGCTLTHANTSGHQDLAIRGIQGQQQVQVGLILTTVSYTAPVQLTVMAQAATAQQIGRVTFQSARGRLGTLLTADWPADSLFPRLSDAARLNFYTPDQHLLHSVRLARSAAAITSLGRCMGYTNSAGPALSPSSAIALAPAPIPLASGSWAPLPAYDGCSIERQTQAGNELSLVFNRRGNLMILLRLRTGPTRFRKSQATLSVAPSRTTPASATPVETGAVTQIVVHADGSSDPLLYGRLDPAQLGSFTNARWNAIALALYDGNGTNVFDRVDTVGFDVMFNALTQCERTLPE